MKEGQSHQNVTDPIDSSWAGVAGAARPKWVDFWVHRPGHGAHTLHTNTRWIQQQLLLMQCPDFITQKDIQFRRPLAATAQTSIAFICRQTTWSKECKVEDQAQQDDPGVGRGTVVVGPHWAVSCLRLVGTSEREKTNFSNLVCREFYRFGKDCSILLLWLRAFTNIFSTDAHRWSAPDLPQAAPSVDAGLTGTQEESYTWEPFSR